MQIVNDLVTVSVFFIIIILFLLFSKFRIILLSITYYYYQCRKLNKDFFHVGVSFFKITL
jgi:hypothetical protein